VGRITACATATDDLRHHFATDRRRLDACTVRLFARQHQSDPYRTCLTKQHGPSAPQSARCVAAWCCDRFRWELGSRPGRHQGCQKVVVKRKKPKRLHTARTQKFQELCDLGGMARHRSHTASVYCMKEKTPPSRHVRFCLRPHAGAGYTAPIITGQMTKTYAQEEGYDPVARNRRRTTHGAPGRAPASECRRRSQRLHARNGRSGTHGCFRPRPT
jgi:hypothetical protein